LSAGLICTYLSATRWFANPRLGFAVVLDPTPGRTPITAGSYYWGGLASTAFWIDPAEELTVSFFTQLIPSSQYPIRPQLRQLVYAALR